MNKTDVRNRGLNDRKKFREDVLNIMRDQGIQAMGVAFTIPGENGGTPYADFDTFIMEDASLLNMDSALSQLKTQYDDEIAMRSNE